MDVLVSRMAGLVSLSEDKYLVSIAAPVSKLGKEGDIVPFTKLVCRKSLTLD